VTDFEAAAASAETHRLAEGPVWDPARERVLWVDIDAGHVLEGVLRGGRVQRTRLHAFGGTVGAVACAHDGRLLVAEQRTLTVLEPGGARTPAQRVIPAAKNSRLNDGACDPAGRFLVGSKPLDGREGDEALYRIEDGGAVRVLDEGLTLSNGLGWSADGARFYSVDSVPGVVWVRDYDAASGRSGARRVFLDRDSPRLGAGVPDGLCLDAEDNLWIAFWGAGQVRCFSPRAEHLATVHVPAPHTSSVAFVGPDLDTLLITTASAELSPQALAAHPDSGRLFTARVGARGLPTAPWAGA
jgi:sugar lactone lactonase YvrE